MHGRVGYINPEYRLSVTLCDAMLKTLASRFLLQNIDIQASNT